MEKKIYELANAIIEATEGGEVIFATSDAIISAAADAIISGARKDADAKMEAKAAKADADAEALEEVAQNLEAVAKAAKLERDALEKRADATGSDADRAAARLALEEVQRADSAADLARFDADEAKAIAEAAHMALADLYHGDAFYAVLRPLTMEDIAAHKAVAAYGKAKADAEAKKKALEDTERSGADKEAIKTLADAWKKAKAEADAWKKAKAEAKAEAKKADRAQLASGAFFDFRFTLGRVLDASAARLGLSIKFVAAEYLRAVKASMEKTLGVELKANVYFNIFENKDALPAAAVAYAHRAVKSAAADAGGGRLWDMYRAAAGGVYFDAHYAPLHQDIALSLLECGERDGVCEENAKAAEKEAARLEALPYHKAKAAEASASAKRMEAQYFYLACEVADAIDRGELALAYSLADDRAYKCASRHFAEWKYLHFDKFDSTSLEAIIEEVEASAKERKASAIAARAEANASKALEVGSAAEKVAQQAEAKANAEYARKRAKYIADALKNMDISARDERVLKLFFAGHSLSEIATKMRTTIKTVRVARGHIARSFAKAIAKNGGRRSAEYFGMIYALGEEVEADAEAQRDDTMIGEAVKIMRKWNAEAEADIAEKMSAEVEAKKANASKAKKAKAARSTANAAKADALAIVGELMTAQLSAKAWASEMDAAASEVEALENTHARTWALVSAEDAKKAKANVAKAKADAKKIEEVAGAKAAADVLKKIKSTHDLPQTAPTAIAEYYATARASRIASASKAKAKAVAASDAVILAHSEVRALEVAAKKTAAASAVTMEENTQRAMASAEKRYGEAQTNAKAARSEVQRLRLEYAKAWAVYADADAKAAALEKGATGELAALRADTAQAIKSRKYAKRTAINQAALAEYRRGLVISGACADIKAIVCEVLKAQSAAKQAIARYFIAGRSVNEAARLSGCAHSTISGHAKAIRKNIDAAIAAAVKRGDISAEYAKNIESMNIVTLLRVYAA